jgi:hypothetical protein
VLPCQLRLQVSFIQYPDTDVAPKAKYHPETPPKNISLRAGACRGLPTTKLPGLGIFREVPDSRASFNKICLRSSWDRDGITCDLYEKYTKGKKGKPAKCANKLERVKIGPKGLLRMSEKTVYRARGMICS